MKIQIYTFTLLSVLTLGFLGGCTTVEPWDRNYLAQDSMKAIPDPLGTSYKVHVQESREGTHGATGISGGGCGCT
ncbi:MAG: DUF4266 domain-containing protein [Alphaproteobacteria bacterium]|jgi:hypothetical protein|nr:DUF4266 domain-containing protein [Alphaproteobacteria bacterium]